MSAKKRAAPKKKTPAKKKASEKKPSRAEQAASSLAFEKVVAAFRGKKGITLPDPEGRGFGASGLKVGGKLFAMSSQGTLVVKLPKVRVDELVEAGRGTRFDPGHGRIMKEWLAVHGGEASWVALAAEAYEFVR